MFSCKMRCPLFIITISLLAFGYSQKFDTTDAVTLSVNSKSSSSCGGCNINIHAFELQWYSQAYTHVAATIVKFVNNATNATITSTVQGNSFQLPDSAAPNAHIVPGSVITSILGGVAYTLTYPSAYQGIGGIERYSAGPVTNANGTVKCVVTKTALTREFLLREYISNGLELSAFLDQGPGPACMLNQASPPMILVRVSSLTTTATNYVDNPEVATSSSAKKALPSNFLTPPTAPRTESSTRLDDRPATTVLASPRKTADVPLITPTSAPSEPIQSDAIKSVLLPANALIASKNRGADETPTTTRTLTPDQPQELSNSIPASRPGGPTPTVPLLQGSRSSPGPNSQIFGIPETDALSHVSSLPIGSSSISNPSDNFPIGDQPFSRPNGKPITTSTTSIGLPNTPKPSSQVLVFPETDVFNFLPIGSSSILVSPSHSFSTYDKPFPPRTKDTSATTPTSLGGSQNTPLPSFQASPGIPSKKAEQSPNSSSPPRGGSSSSLNPSNSYLIGGQTLARPNGKPIITTSTSPDLPNTTPNKHPRPTSLPSVLTFTGQKSITVANPSDFVLNGAVEIHRGGSTIITSGTRTRISLGTSATVIIHDSGRSTTPLAASIVGSSSQLIIPGSQVTADLTSALPPVESATAAAGNNSDLFVGAQTKIAEVPMFVLLGTVFLGIVTPWGMLR